MYVRKILTSSPMVLVRNGAPSRALQTTSAMATDDYRHTLQAEKTDDDKPQTKTHEPKNQTEKDVQKKPDVHQKKGMSEEIKKKSNSK
ncbi:unnamed protein product [Bursaphelenchus okinawaensis]|uniref:Uncharacterized protein n=1 Tax=Bursaphelenchus okinawaensis TaxID=465554 RepID=A0A811KBA7_9BILA|nr:unnamed protein product [Bursaphelenchus okinawaensis]CAG9097519.1 unnamed protein product [Bursaphelenchus okinawaensis]